jgi:hypothetical protein
MIDEYRLKFEIDAGNKAEAVLSNPVIMEAVKAIEQEIIELWQQESDPAKQNSLWHQQTALKAIWQKLESQVMTGKMASQQLGKK